MYKVIYIYIYTHIYTYIHIISYIYIYINICIYIYICIKICIYMFMNIFDLYHCNYLNVQVSFIVRCCELVFILPGVFPPYLFCAHYWFCCYLFPAQFLSCPCCLVTLLPCSDYVCMFVLPDLLLLTTFPRCLYYLCMVMVGSLLYLFNTFVLRILLQCYLYVPALFFKVAYCCLPEL